MELYSVYVVVAVFQSHDVTVVRYGSHFETFGQGCVVNDP